MATCWSRVVVSIAAIASVATSARIIAAINATPACDRFVRIE
ncbi:MAG: hypothetical protein R3E53_14585 [Myxococcota bacterium]